jgi:hypothetical protein
LPDGAYGEGRRRHEGVLPAKYVPGRSQRVGSEGKLGTDRCADSVSIAVTAVARLAESPSVKIACKRSATNRYPE